MKKMTIEEHQALWFRMRRHYLIEGAATAEEVVQRILGIQAQQEGPALLGLSQRMASNPSVVDLLPVLREEGRSLVWTWAQRGTLHFLDAASDWSTITLARSRWALSQRRVGIPNETVVEKSWQILKEKGDLLTKDALEGQIPETYLQEIADDAEKARMTPQRFAATKIMWCLTLKGYLCLAGKKGAQRVYAKRDAWFPQVSWEEQANDQAAAAQLLRRYLAVYAPATPADMATYFGAKVGEVKQWLKLLGEELIQVICGDRRGLLALACDEDALNQMAPAGGWPLRMLPLWDSLLVGHKDKTWMVPDPAENKQIWRPGLYVSATVIARGRIVATWKHKAKRKELQITVTPLALWSKAYETEVQAEAARVARHLGLENIEVHYEPN